MAAGEVLGEQQVRVTSLNAHITCPLCQGYLIDATTVTTCLHTYCRSCLLRHLEKNTTCPRCDVTIKTDIKELNIRRDKSLQDLAYKLVPGLFQTEMMKRREFVRHKLQHNVDSDKTSPAQQEACSKKCTCSQPECKKCKLGTKSPGIMENVSVCLQLFDKHPELHFNVSESLDTRYLLCPGAITVGHVKKFIALKFALSPHHQVTCYYLGERLVDEFTLDDVILVFGWTRVTPLTITYTVRDTVASLLTKAVVKNTKRIVLKAKVANQKRKPTKKTNSAPDGTKSKAEQTFASVPKKEVEFEPKTVICESIAESKQETKSPDQTTKTSLDLSESHDTKVTNESMTDNDSKESENLSESAKEDNVVPTFQNKKRGRKRKDGTSPVPFPVEEKAVPAKVLKVQTEVESKIEVNQPMKSADIDPIDSITDDKKVFSETVNKVEKTVTVSKLSDVKTVESVADVKSGICTEESEQSNSVAEEKGKSSRVQKIVQNSISHTKKCEKQSQTSIQHSVPNTENSNKACDKILNKHSTKPHLKSNNAVSKSKPIAKNDEKKNSSKPTVNNTNGLKNMSTKAKLNVNIPLRIKTDVSRTLFERMLDELSPGKDSNKSMNKPKESLLSLRPVSVLDKTLNSRKKTRVVLNDEKKSALANEVYKFSDEDLGCSPLAEVARPNKDTQKSATVTQNSVNTTQKNATTTQNANAQATSESNDKRQRHASAPLKLKVRLDEKGVYRTQNVTSQSPAKDVKSEKVSSKSRRKSRNTVDTNSDLSDDDDNALVIDESESRVGDTTGNGDDAIDTSAADTDFNHFKALSDLTPKRGRSKSSSVVEALSSSRRASSCITAAELPIEMLRSSNQSNRARPDPAFSLLSPVSSGNTSLSSSEKTTPSSTSDSSPLVSSQSRSDLDASSPLLSRASSFSITESPPGLSSSGSSSCSSSPLTPIAEIKKMPDIGPTGQSNLKVVFSLKPAISKRRSASVSSVPKVAGSNPAHGAKAALIHAMRNKRMLSVGSYNGNTSEDMDTSIANSDKDKKSQSKADREDELKEAHRRNHVELMPPNKDACREKDNIKDKVVSGEPILDTLDTSEAVTANDTDTSERIMDIAGTTPEITMDTSRTKTKVKPAGPETQSNSDPHSTIPTATTTAPVIVNRAPITHSHTAIHHGTSPSDFSVDNSIPTKTLVFPKSPKRDTKVTLVSPRNASPKSNGLVGLRIKPEMKTEKIGLIPLKVIAEMHSPLKDIDSPATGANTIAESVLSNKKYGEGVVNPIPPIKLSPDSIARRENSVNVKSEHYIGINATPAEIMDQYEKAPKLTTKVFIENKPAVLPSLSDGENLASKSSMTTSMAAHLDTTPVPLRNIQGATLVNIPDGVLEPGEIVRTVYYPDRRPSVSAEDTKNKDNDLVSTTPISKYTNSILTVPVPNKKYFLSTPSVPRVPTTSSTPVHPPGVAKHMEPSRTFTIYHDITQQTKAPNLSPKHVSTIGVQDNHNIKVDQSSKGLSISTPNKNVRGKPSSVSSMSSSGLKSIDTSRIPILADAVPARKPMDINANCKANGIDMLSQKLQERVMKMNKMTSSLKKEDIVVPEKKLKLSPSASVSSSSNPVTSSLKQVDMRNVSPKLNVKDISNKVSSNGAQEKRKQATKPQPLNMTTGNKTSSTKTESLSTPSVSMNLHPSAAPLYLNPAFYGHYLPLPPTFGAPYYHPVLPLLPGMERSPDSLYFNRSPMFDRSHTHEFYESLCSPRGVASGAGYPGHAIDAPLDFSTRGAAATSKAASLTSKVTEAANKS